MLYQGFAKRENSTLQPPASATVVPRITLSGCLKNPCSILEPVIEFQTMTAAPFNYSYAFIAVFGRYYFVTDWKWDNALWVAYLKVDVLATYRANIQATYAYIERAASAYDGAIMDNMYPAKSTPSLTTINFLNVPWLGIDEEDGTYILGVIQPTPSGSAGGAVTYYALDHTEMYNLMDYLLSDQFYEDAGFAATPTTGQEVSQDVAKGLLNPIQYLVSCMWFPCDKTTFSLSQNTVAIKVGPWVTIGTGKYLIDSVTYSQIFRNLLTNHPQAATRGKYLNYAPYTSVSVCMPPFGQFPLDMSYFSDTYTRLRMDLQVDCITGKACLQVGSENPDNLVNNIFYETTGQIGVPIQLAQVTPDTLKQMTAMNSGITGAAGMVAGLLTGSAMGAIYGGGMLLQSITNATAAQLPQATSAGVNGSFISYDLQNGTHPTATIKHLLLVDEDNVENGRPLCAIRQLSTLSGYVKCGEVTVDYPCFEPEKKEILRYLLGGFFKE